MCVGACIHTYIQTGMHTCIHTYIHTYIHIHIYSYIYSHQRFCVDIRLFTDMILIMIMFFADFSYIYYKQVCIMPVVEQVNF